MRVPELNVGTARSREMIHFGRASARRALDRDHRRIAEFHRSLGTGPGLVPQKKGALGTQGPEPNEAVGRKIWCIRSIRECLRRRLRFH